MKVKITSGMENYLETIYELSELKETVHVKDISDRLNIKMPSVSEAIRRLAEQGLVDFLPYQDITLTAKGLKIGKEIHGRHHLFMDFLSKILNLPEELAASEACKLEHVLCDETVQALQTFMRKNS